MRVNIKRGAKVFIKEIGLKVYSAVTCVVVAMSSDIERKLVDCSPSI